MRWWHLWRHGPPTFGILYPPQRDWCAHMRVLRDVICPCGRYWHDEYIVRQKREKAWWVGLTSVWSRWGHSEL